MDFKESFRGIIMVLLASIVLALSVTFNETSLILNAFISFVIIILTNIFIKKAVGYYFETQVKISFWSWYQFGFRKDSHFKKPIPMVWLPLILSLFTKGFFWWLAILEFDVKAKAERATKRHGLYRFTQVTEWHMALIALWGIIANLILAIAGYLVGFEFFTKLSIYFALWSILPLSRLDGSRILFGSRPLWITFLIILAIFFGWAIVI